MLFVDLKMEHSQWVVEEKNMSRLTGHGPFEEYGF
jgi:hypothetical protein